MQTTTPQHHFKSRILFYIAIITVFFISSFVYIQYGFNGYLFRDDAIYLYSGQQMAKGIPPYVSIFDHKGPITPMIAGISIMFSDLVNTDDILTVRTFFFIISVFTVVSLFLFTFELFNSSYKTAFLTSFVFINFWGYGKHAASGPRGKTPVVLFETISLWLTYRRMWFFASFFGSLAFLTWQPTIIFPVITIFLALIQSKNTKERIVNVFKAVSGALIPLIVISSYFLYKDAFTNFADGFILFNRTYLTRIREISILANIKAFFREIIISYTTMSIPILVGLTMILVIFLWRMHFHKNNASLWISQDRFTGLLLTFPLPFIWSLFDFQWYGDFYVFLPYAAIGFGWFLNHATENLWKFECIAKHLQKKIFIIFCCILIFIAAVNYRLTAKQALENFESQVSWAEEFKTKYGNDIKIASINVPEALVILHETNPSPYIYISEGIDQYINVKTPGGFSGWLETLGQYEPAVIFFKESKGIFMSQMEYWLENHYDETTVGKWIIFVKDKAVE